MAKAIELSINSANTVGGPFGSVIVKDNKIYPIEIKKSFNPGKKSIKNFSS